MTLTKMKVVTQALFDEQGLPVQTDQTTKVARLVKIGADHIRFPSGCMLVYLFSLAK